MTFSAPPTTFAAPSVHTNLLALYKEPDGASKTVLFREGRKYLRVLMMEDGALTVRKISKAEARWIEPLRQRGSPYPVDRALRIYHTHGRLHGWTQGARDFLVARTEAYEKCSTST